MEHEVSKKVMFLAYESPWPAHSGGALRTMGLLKELGKAFTTYQELLECVFQCARVRRPACVTQLAVHGLVTVSRDRELWDILNEFEAVALDGMPVKLALNALYKIMLPDRVYGPEFTPRVCERAAAMGTGVYLYGSYTNAFETLCKKMIER